MNENTWYIIRGDHSGVFFGKIGRRVGREVEIRECRQLWFWSGARDLREIAKEGVRNPERCKFTVTVPSLAILDAIELIPCTDKAVEIISGVPEWTM